jgi:hypothetical protein
MDGNLNRLKLDLKKKSFIFFYYYFQIVNVGSHYNYTHEDHSEYLLIVSKEYGGAHLNDNNTNDNEGSDKRKVKKKLVFL